MKIIKGKEKEYKDLYNEKLNSYEHGCFIYAERLADMLEDLIKSSADEPMKVVFDNAKRISNEADIEGITGFMYVYAVGILSKYWEYGEELRKWHNKK